MRRAGRNRRLNKGRHHGSIRHHPHRLRLNIGRLSYCQLFWRQKSEEQAQLNRFIEVAKTGLRLKQQQSEMAQQDRQNCLTQFQSMSVPYFVEVNKFGENIDQLQQGRQRLEKNLLSHESVLQVSRQQEKTYQKQLFLYHF